MDLMELLQAKSGEILDEAVESVRRAHLRHYEVAGPEATRRRIEGLYALTVESVTTRSATRLVDFAEKLAGERFAAGFDLAEVQIAFNVLEEAIWKRILAEVPPVDLARALGLVSTVLGLGKDSLARAYVSLASERKAPSLDLRALFAGTNGV